MNKVTRFLLLGLLAVLVVIQFVGPKAPETRIENPQDLLLAEQVDATVAGMLKNACYDCHSMETKYPWYAGIAPVSWRVYGHINHGREELNFSEWGSLKKLGKVKRLKDIEEIVAAGNMPLSDYTWLHPEAKLSESQRAQLSGWAADLAKGVMGK